MICSFICICCVAYQEMISQRNLTFERKKSLKYLDVWVDKEWINVDQP